MLYRALHVDYKKFMEHVVEGDKLSMMGDQDQGKLVKTVVTFVGVDMPIYITNRIIGAYKNLQKRIRRRDKTPSRFANRFRAKASEYKVLAGMKPTGRDSQLLAMILL